MLRYRVQSVYRSEQVLRAIAGHKAILEAIERSDEAEVSLAIKNHLVQSKMDILHYAFDDAWQER
jgi:DNA-binding GntR family transcriptional regulator